MASLTDNVKTKLLEMRTILGKEAADKVVSEAEKREQAALDAGIEVKGDDPVANKAKVDETETETEELTLSELLAELEAGLESGQIVDDVSDGEPAENEDELKEADAAFRHILKEVVTEVFDAKFKEFLTNMALKEASADPKVAALKKQMDANEAAATKLKEQMDELLGVQPKNKPATRASQDETTKVKGNDPLAQDQPHADPVSAFISDFVMAPPHQNGTGA